MLRYGSKPQDVDIFPPHSAQDFKHPLYFAHARDPKFTISYTEPWSACEGRGNVIRIPDAAQASGGGDGHMTVVQPNGDEYDFWRVQEKNGVRGKLVTSCGGITRIDGEGLGTAATAAHFSTLAGVIRPEELAGQGVVADGTGNIDHALFITVPCDSGSYVYPAAGLGRPCSAIGRPTTNAPPEGARLCLDYTVAVINAMPIPEEERRVWRAASCERYGMYIGDTGGDSSRIFGLSFLGGDTYTSFGYEDPFRKMGRIWDWPRDGDVYTFKPYAAPIDWHRLRVVAPCVSRRTCR
jgi:hypothetical protein